MKKQVRMVLVFVAVIFMLSGCGTEEELAAAQEAADAYNAQVAVYNEELIAYNEAVQAVAAANEELDSAIDAAQTALNQGEEPYDPETETALASAISDARSAEISVPDEIADEAEVTVDEEASKSELEAFTEEITEELELLAAQEVPEIPDIPDYSEYITALEDTLQAYETSIISLQQITAPSDDFVIERLQTIETITEIAAVTEDHDPNGKLNKQGGYIGCIYFTDSQVDRSQLYIEEGEDNVIDVGTIGGGAVEIFSNVEDAETRDAYLGMFDGTFVATGSHYVVGTLVIRVSDELTASQQLDLTDQIISALIEVK